MWEDLHVNEAHEAAQKQLLICKCYRYVQGKNKFDYGGCNTSVARPGTQPELLAPGGQPAVEEPSPADPPMDAMNVDHAKEVVAAPPPAVG